ncbi:MAG: glycosyltransferase [Flavobacteriales bacterium]|jgi:glycosyltransferase involved in cell wall biosynthesis|nr:glycosyltransferase [Flavobacteriales bacterium]
MMRIVHLCTNDFGGAAVAAINLHEALLAQGIESDLLTLGRTRNDVQRHHAIAPFELAGSPLLARARYHARRAMEKAGLVDDRSVGPGNANLQGRPSGLEIFSLPYSFFDAGRHPLVQRADIVHLHWVSRGMIGFDRFFARCSSPIVWTMHDMNPFTGGCHHADACHGFTRECRDCPQLADKSKAHGYWRVKQVALKGFPKDRKALVAPSEWLAARARRSSILAGRECTVIPNGFDLRTLNPMPRAQARAALGLPMEARIILFSAFDAANPRKGMPLLLKALDELGIDAHLVSMGHPMQDLLDRPRTTSTGLLNDASRIAMHYAAADLFVLPSLAENLPNTISESLLCGTPVVAFNVGGIPEQVHAGNGLLVEAGHAVGLRDAMREALLHPWDRSSIAGSAAARYDRTRIAGRYAQLYSDLRS